MVDIECYLVLLKQQLLKELKELLREMVIAWQNGMSPFRKFSFSFLRDQQALTDKQIMLRFGWSNMDTPNKWYYRDLDNKQGSAIKNCSH